MCVPNLVAIRRSCRKKGGGTDRQTHTQRDAAALYSRWFDPSYYAPGLHTAVFSSYGSLPSPLGWEHSQAHSRCTSEQSLRTQRNRHVVKSNWPLLNNNLQIRTTAKVGHLPGVLKASIVALISFMLHQFFVAKLTSQFFCHTELIYNIRICFMSAVVPQHW